MADSARNYDDNGFFEIKDNPISRVGVFEYLGSSIGADDPDRIYKVYRPAEELGSAEAIDSFRLAPLINDHTMLGEGETPAEKKGVQGVIGDGVYFKDGVLYANLKVFGTHLANLIKKGKRDLSLGYRCRYDFTSGSYNGERYDAIQRELRGNHIALVDEGRMGKAVAVLDSKDCFKFTINKTEDSMENEGKKPILSDEEIIAIAEAIKAHEQAEMAEKAGDEDEEVEALPEAEDAECESTDSEGEEVASDSDESETEAKDSEEVASDSDESEEGEKKESAQDSAIKAIKAFVKKQVSMDSLERQLMKRIESKSKLVKQLQSRVGVFDSSEMTLNDVARYGLKKMGVKAIKGHEVAQIEGYLSAGAKTSVKSAQDSAVKSLSINDIYFK